MKSIADELRHEQRRAEAAEPACDKVARARALGERAVADFAVNHGLSIEQARREIERRKQLTRRPSAVMRSLTE